MINNFKQAIKKTKQETKLWSYAAWTLPFVALALIVFEHFIGHDDWIRITLVFITTVFFSISVFWWWWALNKFAIIMSSMKSTEDRFHDVIYEIRETRKTIRELEDDVGDR